MPCHASPFNLQPQTDLRAEPIGRGVRSAKQGHDTDPLARPQELPCQFKSNASAGAVAGNNKRTVWLKGGDLRGKISCQLFDAAQRLRVAVEPRRLQSEKGLILAQMPHQRSISKNVAIVTGDRENRNFRAVWLERDDRALLTGQGVSRMQKFENLGLALPQLLVQLSAEGAGWRATSQLTVFGPNLNVASAKCLEKAPRVHTSTTSRSPAGW